MSGVGWKHGVLLTASEGRVAVVGPFRERETAEARLAALEREARRQGVELDQARHVYIDTGSRSLRAVIGDINPNAR